MKTINLTKTQLEKQLSKKIKRLDTKPKELIILKQDEPLEITLAKANQLFCTLINKLNIHKSIADDCLDLIDKKHKYFNRLLLNQEQNFELNKKLVGLLLALSFEFVDLNYVVLLDYLILKFDVLSFEYRELMIIFLSFHETKQYNKMAMLMSEETENIKADDIIYQLIKHIKTKKSIKRKELVKIVTKSHNMEDFIQDLFKVLLQLERFNCNNVLYGFVVVFVQEILLEIANEKEKMERINRIVMNTMAKTKEESTVLLKKTLLVILLNIIDSVVLKKEIIDIVIKEIRSKNLAMNPDTELRAVSKIINSQYRSGLKLDVESGFIVDLLNSECFGSVDRNNINVLKYAVDHKLVTFKMAEKISNANINSDVYAYLKVNGLISQTSPALLLQDNSPIGEIRNEMINKNVDKVDEIIENMQNVGVEIEMEIIECMFDLKVKVKLNNKYNIINPRLIESIENKETAIEIISTKINQNIQLIEQMIEHMITTKRTLLFVDVVMETVKTNCKYELMYKVLDNIQHIVHFAKVKNVITNYLQFLNENINEANVLKTIEYSIKHNSTIVPQIKNINLLNKIIPANLNQLEIVMEIIANTNLQLFEEANYELIILLLHLLIKNIKNTRNMILVVLEKTKIAQTIKNNKAQLKTNSKNINLLEIDNLDIVKELLSSNNGLHVLYIYVSDICSNLFSLKAIGDCFVDILIALSTYDSYRSDDIYYSSTIAYLSRNTNISNSITESKITQLLNKLITSENVLLIKQITHNPNFINKFVSSENRAQIVQKILKTKNKQVHELLSKIIINTKNNNNEEIFVKNYSKITNINQWIEINLTKTDVKYNDLVHLTIQNINADVEHLSLINEMLINNYVFTLNKNSIDCMLALFKNNEDEYLSRLIVDIFVNRIECDDYCLILDHLSTILNCSNISSNNKIKIMLSLIKINGDLKVASKLIAFLTTENRDIDLLKKLTSVLDVVDSNTVIYDELVLVLLSNNIKINNIKPDRLLQIIVKTLNNNTSLNNLIDSLNHLRPLLLFYDYEIIKRILDHKNIKLNEYVVSNTKPDVLVKLITDYINSGNSEMVNMIYSHLKNTEYLHLIVEPLVLGCCVILTKDVVINNNHNKQIITQILDTILNGKMSRLHPLITDIVISCEVGITHINRIVNEIVLDSANNNELLLAAMIEKHGQMFGVEQLVEIINKKANEQNFEKLAKPIDYSTKYEVINRLTINNLTLKIITQTIKNNPADEVKSNLDQLIKLMFTKIINHQQTQETEQIITDALLALSLKLMDMKLIKAILLKTIKMDRIQIATLLSFELIRNITNETLEELIFEKIIKHGTQINEIKTKTFIKLIPRLSNKKEEIIAIYDKTMQKIDQLGEKLIIKVNIKMAKADNSKYLELIYKKLIKNVLSKENNRTIIIKILLQIYKKIKKQTIKPLIPQILPVIMELKLIGNFDGLLDCLIEQIEIVNGHKLLDLIK